MTNLAGCGGSRIVVVPEAGDCCSEQQRQQGRGDGQHPAIGEAAPHNQITTSIGNATWMLAQLQGLPPVW